MPHALLISLKIVGVVATTLLVVFLATDSELALHFGTTILALLASAVLFFAKPLAVRAQAVAFLLLTVGVSHAVDRYFWGGVWERGYGSPGQIVEIELYWHYEGGAPLPRPETIVPWERGTEVTEAEQ